MTIGGGLAGLGGRARRARPLLSRARGAFTAAADDAGVTTVEMVLLTSVMLVVTLLAVQAGVLFHARHIVTAAAQEGARAARVVDLDAGSAQAAGADRAARFATGLGGRTVVDPQVSVERGTEQVRVVVNGRAVAVLPWLTLRVRGDSTAPVERFVPG